jgi:hypothetical protein
VSQQRNSFRYVDDAMCISVMNDTTVGECTERNRMEAQKEAWLFSGNNNNTKKNHNHEKDIVKVSYGGCIVESQHYVSMNRKWRALPLYVGMVYCTHYNDESYRNIAS